MRSKNIQTQSFLLGVLLLIITYSCSSKKENKYDNQVDTSFIENSSKTTVLPPSSDKVDCRVNNLEALKGKTAYEKLQKIYEQAEMFELSPQQKYLIYNDKKALKIYDLVRDISFIVEENFGQEVKVSKFQWSKDEETAAYVLVDASNTPQIRTFTMRGSKISNRKKYPVATIKIDEKTGCPRNIDVGFNFESQRGDSLITYQSTEKWVFYRYLYLYKIPFEQPLNIIVKGFSASSTAYGVVNDNNEEVALPQKIKEKVVFSFLPPDVIPGTKKIVFSDTQSDTTAFLIKTYETDTKKEEILLRLPGKRDGISPIIWSPDKQSFAFVDVNQQDYKVGTKLYVFQLETGKLSTFDAPINFVCGASCYVQAQEDFWFKDDTTIQYKIHLLKNQGQKATTLIHLEDE